MSNIANDRPTLLNFDPTQVPSQELLIDDFYYRIANEGGGLKQILLSGSVGSAKSISMCHIICRMALQYPGIKIGLGKRTMPLLKATLIKDILEHLPEEVVANYNKSSGQIDLVNGTQMLPFSWADGKFKKVRTFEFTVFAIEEFTETDDDEIYDEILMRIRQNYNNQEHRFLAACADMEIPPAPPKVFIAATNPDEPDHFIYERMIAKAGWIDGERIDTEEADPNINIYYSKTLDNPHLKPDYIETLKSIQDPQMAERMLFGKWISIKGEGIYTAYDPDIHYKQADYKVNPRYPVHISFDFNVADGKPASTCMFQYINDTFHFFDEAVVHSTNTHKMMTELDNRGIFDKPWLFIINGDHTGWNKHSSSKNSDYAVIKEYLENHPARPEFEIKVLKKRNPPVKARHNLVNAYMKNLKGQVRLYVYNDCKILHKGFKLTSLKQGANYIEDDSKDYQHVTTAAGYGIYETLRKSLGSMKFLKN